MQIPHTAIGAALARPTKIGRMLAAMRQRAILPVVTAHATMLAPTATARALAEFSAEIGRIPETVIRKALP
jgi:hypothetical protein